MLKEAERGKKQEKKRENGKEKKENCKRGGGKLKMEGGKGMKMSRGGFFFFFFFFACHFLEPLKFVWVYQNGNFYREKSISRWEKLENGTLLPLKNIPLMPLYIDIYYGGKFLTLPPLTAHLVMPLSPLHPINSGIQNLGCVYTQSSEV